MDKFSWFFPGTDLVNPIFLLTVIDTTRKKIDRQTPMYVTKVATVFGLSTSS